MTPSPSAGEPAPCPFCGLPPTKREHSYSDETGEHIAYVAIECIRHECGGSEPTLFCGVHAEDEESAIEAWNRRAAPPATASEQDVERVAEAIGRDWWEQTAGELHPTFWAAQPEEQRNQWRQVARAAIAALPASGERERVTRVMTEAVVGALRDWADALFATRDQYIDAMKTGTMNGRRIKKEMARQFAGQFRERGEAVLGAIDVALCALASPAAAGDEK